MAAARLQSEHHGRKLVGRRDVAFDLPAHLEVLAKDTAQVAAAEEDGSGASRAPQAVFLPEVREITADPHIAAGATDGELVRQPVDMAITRAEHAITELA